jgi:GT2 family glycosyltransferase
MDNELVAIIIINWNGYEDTIECIESLSHINYPNYKIVLIDNGSNNENVAALKNNYEKNNNIILILNKENTGFAGGTNIGIKESIKLNATYTLLLNNDTIVDPAFMSELVKTAKKDEKIGIVTSSVYYFEEPTVIWEKGSFFNYYFPPLSKRYTGENEQEVSDVVGCCMLIKNNVFNDVGLFDEEYFVYGEESDFNIRTRKAGYKLFSAPQSKIWHKISRSTGGGFNKTVAYYKMRNKIKYAKKNYDILKWPTYFIFLLLYFLKEQYNAITNNKYDVSVALVKGVKDSF